MPEFNAFTGGVEPGGLRSQNDIRILICYLLTSVNAPLSAEDIAKILQEKALANYFEIGDALSSLCIKKNIRQNENGDYEILPPGREIARELDTVLPLSVRDKTLESAVALLSRARNEWENRVEIDEQPRGGYQVTLHISGGNFDMMRLTLQVPDKKQAKLVKENFHRDPLRIYSLLLAALTGDKSMQRELLEDSAGK